MKKVFVLLAVTALCFAGCKSAVEDVGQVETSEDVHSVSVGQSATTTAGETVQARHVQGNSVFGTDSDTPVPYVPGTATVDPNTIVDSSGTGEWIAK